MINLEVRAAEAAAAAKAEGADKKAKK
jgi:hypothetical protein